MRDTLCVCMDACLCTIEQCTYLSKELVGIGDLFMVCAFRKLLHGGRSNAGHIQQVGCQLVNTPSLHPVVRHFGFAGIVSVSLYHASIKNKNRERMG